MTRWCPQHGRFPRSLGRCPACPPKRGSDTAARAAQRAFRDSLVAASDGRCQYVGPDGNRCPETAGLQAAHVGEQYRAAGRFGAGALVCRQHHRMLDRSG